MLQAIFEDLRVEDDFLFYDELLFIPKDFWPAKLNWLRFGDPGNDTVLASVSYMRWPDFIYKLFLKLNFPEFVHNQVKFNTY